MSHVHEPTSTSSAPLEVHTRLSGGVYSRSACHTQQRADDQLYLRSVRDDDTLCERIKGDAKRWRYLDGVTLLEISGKWKLSECQHKNPLIFTLLPFVECPIATVFRPCCNAVTQAQQSCVISVTS